MIDQVLTRDSDALEEARKILKNWADDVETNGVDAATEKLSFIIATLIRDKIKDTFSTKDDFKTTLHFEFDTALDCVHGFVQMKDSNELIRIIETLVARSELTGTFHYVVQQAERRVLMAGLTKALGGSGGFNL